MVISGKKICWIRTVTHTRYILVIRTCSKHNVHELYVFMYYVLYFETLWLLPMELNDVILVQYRPLPRKLLLALSKLNVSCFTKYRRISDRFCRFFCAYFHRMYDFTRLTRAIVCGEIDLCWHFESGVRRRISKKKSWLYCGKGVCNRMLCWLVRCGGLVRC